MIELILYGVMVTVPLILPLISYVKLLKEGDKRRALIVALLYLAGSVIMYMTLEYAKSLFQVDALLVAHITVINVIFTVTCIFGALLMATLFISVHPPKRE